MNDLENHYFPFRRDMVCLAVTARHLMSNKTTCNDFRTKAELDQDRARPTRDFFCLLGQGIQGHQDASGALWTLFVDPAVCPWAEAAGLPGRCGTQHLPLGCYSPFTAFNSHLGRGGRFEMSSPEPSPAPNALLSACQECLVPRDRYLAWYSC